MAANLEMKDRSYFADIEQLKERLVGLEMDLMELRKIVNPCTAIEIAGELDD